MSEVVQEKFSISYDSETGDFKGHKIDALELGNSILGVYNLVAETNSLVNKGGEVDLKVTAPAKEGSVVVDFLLLASSPAGLAVLKYLGFSSAVGGAVGGSLIEVVRKLKGRRVASVTIEGDSDVATIEVDGQKIVCDKYVAKLAVDKKVRDSLHSVIQAPIAGKGSARFKVLDSQEAEVLEVKEAVAHVYSPLPPQSLEEEEVTRERVTVYFVQVNFESNRGWRIKFADGKEHSATLDDERFFNRVKENKQSFAKDDLFEVELETKATYRQTRSSYEYRVIEVTRHFAAKDRRLV
ncbi:TPA: hypothetical protein NOT17_003816 [Pseudomonas aeruginosa]|uniref:hypothetical protein n=1 Tax=Pseudomonas aeruginosa TaxID=287 RepID=UPI003D7BB89B|nr:hypothetical protein [Pseudomonas aeruginosa]